MLISATQVQITQTTILECPTQERTLKRQSSQLLLEEEVSLVIMVAILIPTSFTL